MPHVDDGILHAYLDGALDALDDAGELPDGMTAADVAAHLSTCPDCNARLRTERDIRERSGLVLKDALPRVAVPPFAEITAARRRSPRRTFLPLAWAATVLLAVGAGWWGSVLWRAQGIPGMAAREQESAPALSSPSAPAPQQSAPQLRDASQTRQAASVPPPGTPRQSTAEQPESLPQQEAAALDQTTSELSRAAARGIALGAAAPGITSGAAAPGIALRAADTQGIALTGPPQVRAAEPRPQPIGTPVAGDVAGAERSPVSATIAAAPPPAAPAPNFRRFVPADSAEPQRVLRQRADRGEPVQVDARTGNQAYLHIPRADGAAFDSILAREQSGRMRFVPAAGEHQRTIDDQLFIIADGSDPVIEIANEIGQTTVRVRQTLASGQSIEVLSWQQHAVELNELVVSGVSGRTDARAEAAASKAAEDRALPAFTIIGESTATLPDGRRQLLLRATGDRIWIALRADASPGDLRTLMSQLKRASPAR